MDENVALMHNLFGREVFACGGRTYLWEHVLAGAALRRDWAELEAYVRGGIACSKWAEDAGAQLGDEELQSAADAFRYDRGLLTVDETEAWLREWGISSDAWLGSLQRRLLRERHESRAGAPLPDLDVPSEEIAACVAADAVCGGFLSRWARELASRAAASEALNGRTVDLREPIAFQDPPACPGLASRVDADAVALLCRIESAFDVFRRDALTPRAIADQTVLHRLDWVRIRCDRATFTDDQAAREAVLCVRSDGQSLGDVALLANAAAGELTCCLDDLEPAWRDALLAATPGDVVGPLEAAGEFTVLVIRDKVLPAAADDAVRVRAEAAALRSALESEVNRRVRWRTRV